jgi:4-amino-4-deoxy-L-arabinose transferase-like glycosyltransferase
VATVTTESQPTVRTRSVVRSRANAAVPLLLAAAAGGLVAVCAAYFLWPNGSHDLDELVYLNQAEAIRHGQLTYDTDSYAPDFRPYLSGVAGDRVVFKYQPLWPAWLALSQAATGDHRPGLVVAGMVAAMAFWLLGRELTGSPWLGTALAVGVALSPVFVAHSATALAYLPAAALAAAFLAAALRGVRTGSRWWFATSGLCIGALAFHRPFDAALVGAPVAAWLAVRAARTRDWRAPAVMALAAAPFALAWLGYNLAATGDALTPAFSVDAPSDTFGFGRRASWEATGVTFVDGAVDYTPAGAARTVVTFAAVTPLWIAGGAVSLALMAAAMVLGRRDQRRWVLLSTIVLVIVAYFFWWGTKNFVDFGLHTALGPAYWLIALGPAAGLVVLGGRDAVDALCDHPRRRRLLTAGTVGFLVMTLPAIAYVAFYFGDTREARRNQLAGVDAAPPGTILLFPTGVSDPFLRTLVPADLAATTRLHAVDLDSVDQRFRLRDRFPDRPLWAWVQDRPAGTMLDSPEGYDLGELPEASMPEAVIDTAVDAGDGRITSAWLRTLDASGDELARHPMAASADPEPVAAEATGSPAADGDALAVGADPGWLAAGVTVVEPDGHVERVEVRWMIRARDGQVDVIGPGFGYRRYEFPDRSVWFQEDVSARLTADLAGLEPFAPVRHTGPRD